MPCEQSLSAVEGPVRDILLNCGQGATPPAATLMRLAMATTDETDFERAIEATRTISASLDAAAAGRFAALRALAQSAPGAWSLVRSMLTTVSHEQREQGTVEARLVEIATAFDRAATLSPAGSVALYSFGRVDLLEAATDEVVAYLDRLGLLGADRALLDIGCGVGRFEQALAGKVATILGLDISPAMVEIARRNCAGLANVEIRLSSGKDLAGVADASIDCALAIDAFPYIVSASPALAENLFRAVAQALKPGGDFLLANYSYRGGDDRADVARLAEAYGFRALRPDERPFRFWDGRLFHLGKQA